ncbi:hypothetical protein [Neptuniibacter caesariensis]|uniref:Uncharacterized protein n=1 Tax=Neptuniibacter caesariensis TaxID=207954 RepID=A0A7U8C5E0_NEPCE|nr:hypothetical protein [Neptuniibacter caesariensis]EAR60229.1 hypothetical protein MED92_17319 [Oceanospirillum sp. MED92] [Neptuniibacter caesariensis]
MQADVLLQQAFQALAVPYGFEYSCKLTKGALNCDRFLLTQHKSAFFQKADNFLLSQLALLKLPHQAQKWFLEQIENAELIHLGYEAEGCRPRCKLYLEYPLVLDSPVPTDAGRLLHRAVKWLPGDEQFVVTDYWLLELNPARLNQFVSDALNGSELSIEINRLVDKLCSEQVPMVLKVVEPDTGRYSFDLNLYDYDLKLSDVMELMDYVFDYFAIADEQRKAFLDRNKDKTLGHIAAGVSRQGEFFLTLYFGVEERK